MSRTPGSRAPDEGASAVEYGLIVFLIAAVLVAVIAVIGSRIQGRYHDTCEARKCAPAR